MVQNCFCVWGWWSWGVAALLLLSSSASPSPPLSLAPEETALFSQMADTSSEGVDYANLIEPLRDMEDADRVIQACEALSKLVFNNQVHKVLAGRAGAVGALTTCVRTHPTDKRVQISALKCLRHCIFQIPDNIQEASSAGAVAAAVGALRAHGEDEAVVAEVIWVLSMMAKEPQAMPLVRRLLGEIREAGERFEGNTAITTKVQYIAALAEMEVTVTIEVVNESNQGEEGVEETKSPGAA